MKKPEDTQLEELILEEVTTHIKENRVTYGQRCQPQDETITRDRKDEPRTESPRRPAEMRKMEGKPNYNHCRRGLSDHLTNLPGTGVVPADQGNKLTRADQNNVTEDFQLLAGPEYLEYVMMSQKNHQSRRTAIGPSN